MFEKFLLRGTAASLMYQYLPGILRSRSVLQLLLFAIAVIMLARNKPVGEFHTQWMSPR